MGQAGAQTVILVINLNLSIIIVPSLNLLYLQIYADDINLIRGYPNYPVLWQSGH